jgi:predicted RNA polymerase sigma factor
VHQALGRRPPGRFALMAAIAAVHARAPSWEATDWKEIVGLYDLLVAIWPSPVVALNRAVALGLADGPTAGLVALDALGHEPLLATYSYFASSRADFLRQVGRSSEARLAYEEALLLSENAVERAFLLDRLGQMETER